MSINLHQARDHWKERRRLKTEWLRQMTVFESVAEMERLYADSKERLEADDEFFLPQRLAYLTELQARLRRHGEHCRGSAG